MRLKSLLGGVESQAVAETEPDWATQIVDRIDQAVGAVRDRAVVPLVTLARALVFGVVIAVLAVVMLVLLIIALIRGVDLLVPRSVWAADLIVGTAFLLVGLLLWRKRSVRGPRTEQ